MDGRNNNHIRLINVIKNTICSHGKEPDILIGFTSQANKLNIKNRWIPEYPHINHVKFLARHLLNSQYGLSKIAGIHADMKWNDLFAVMGQSDANDDVEYPAVDEILAEWNQMYEPVRGGLASLEADELNARPPSPFDQVSESRIHLWAFITHHQAYHIGQIGILQRAFGK